MLAVSTSFLASPTATAGTIINKIQTLGAGAVELEYRLSGGTVAELTPLLRQAGISIDSVHNYFPIPAEMPESKGSGDLFLLSSLDEEHRKIAVEYTRRTINVASDLGARAVVLHCGRVEMDEERDRIYDYIKSNQMDSDEARLLMDRKLAERERVKAPYVDQLIKSLEALAESAQVANITLGLENRYHYHELPGPLEFPALFQALSGAPFGYWHDTGHAHMLDLLGVASAESMLEQNADRLVGVHLHDAIGRQDHLPPGRGEIDFQSVLLFLKPNVLRVMELRPRTAIENAAEGFAFLKAQGF